MIHVLFHMSHFRLQRGANQCPQCMLSVPFGEASIDADQAAVSYPNLFAIVREHQWQQMGLLRAEPYCVLCY